MEWLRKNYKFLIFTALPAIITIYLFVKDIINFYLIWEFIKDLFRRVVNFYSNEIRIWQTISLVLLISNFFFIFKLWHKKETTPNKENTDTTTMLIRNVRSKPINYADGQGNYLVMQVGEVKRVPKYLAEYLININYGVEEVKEL